METVPSPVPEPARAPLSFARTRELPVPAADAFAWHARPGALPRLTPPWEDVAVESATGGIRAGAEVVLKLNLGPVPVRWHALHTAFDDRGDAGGMFRDVQTSGPFAFWEHTHEIAPAPKDPARSTLTDAVRYLPPGGPLGKTLGAGFAEKKLAAMFAYRHAVTAADLAAHHRFRDEPRRRVLISGATGLIGSQLAPFLTGGGHDTAALSRSVRGDGTVRWDPAAGEIDAVGLTGFDAVVHRAGETIQGRWTAGKKRRIRDSRVDGTRLLCEALAKLERRPEVLVCAGAIGVYGDRGGDVLTEESAPGDDFLAETAVAWERACDPARDAGIRVVNTRFGIVLSPEGGALGKQLPIFRAGGGGPVGRGEQWWSWVSRDDAVGAVHHALMDRSVRGPINVTAPGATTNAEFTRTLADVLHRPAVVPVPAFAVRLAFGEMGEALLLTSTRVKPASLTAAGYRFRHPELGAALRHMLGQAT